MTAVCVSVCLDPLVAAALSRRAARDHHTLQAEMRLALAAHVAARQPAHPIAMGAGEWAQDTVTAGSSW